MRAQLPRPGRGPGELGAVPPPEALKGAPAPEEAEAEPVTADLADLLLKLGRFRREPVAQVGEDWLDAIAAERLPPRLANEWRELP